MSRPKKNRKVCFIPNNQQFYPESNNKEEVVVTVEEIESMRLADYEGLDQVEAAKRMHVSRGTFQRIICEARKKIADSLVNGKIIKISGGNYKLSCDMGTCGCKCKQCVKECRKEE